MINSNFKKGFHSLCVKDDIIESNSAHVQPIYATSTFTYTDIEKAFDFFKSGKRDDVFTYSRLGNPTVQSVATKLAKLETYGIDTPSFGALFASGMAAISTGILSYVKSGDKILTQGNLYGTTNELLNTFLKDWGIETIQTDFKNLKAVEEFIINDESIRLIYIETPVNPTIELIDIASIVKLAKNYGIHTVADNTFATPYFLQPIKHGVDMVVHSSTKFLNGHGTGTSGVVICTDEQLFRKKVYSLQKMLGGICSPFEAFLLNNGIKTLPLRMEQHQKNALQLAAFLEAHPKVYHVNYIGLKTHQDHVLAQQLMKGFGGMLSFDLVGGLESGMEFLRHIQFCTITASLGTADTLVTHPASTSHVNVSREQRLAYQITDGLIRVSVGLENIEDILSDFSQALDAI